jgi:8-oxo-dGTP diphosphatase
MNYSYKYARAALTVDCVVFGFDFDSGTLQVLLIRRAAEPFKDYWALPGKCPLDR